METVIRLRQGEDALWRWHISQPGRPGSEDDEGFRWPRHSLQTALDFVQEEYEGRFEACGRLVVTFEAREENEGS